MADQLRALSPTEEKSVNLAAALARKQLQLASEIVDQFRPGPGTDSLLIGAVLSAIASNYAAVKG